MLKTSNSVLIPFDCIINLDFGIIKTLKQKYNNPKFFLPKIFNNNDDFFRYSTISNENASIVDFYLRDEHRDKANTIERQLFEREYSQILENSEPTSILILAKHFMMVDGAINVTILCKNELEQQYINRIDNNLKGTIDDLYNMDLSIYDSIFFKNITDIARLNLEGKNLYVLGYKSNFEDDFKTLLKSITDSVGDINIFYTVDVYQDLQKPVG